MPKDKKKSKFANIKVRRQENTINQLRPEYLKKAEIRIQRAPKGSSEKILKDALKMQQQDDESTKRFQRRK